ncbi:MAG: response regulator transcription factor [Pseudomonadales bacterium]|nr:response regulator transcription factor [Pseudomonadales bacterium]MBP9033560.1 response regulator transcription factor [Pseudomonadales bacterium]
MDTEDTPLERPSLLLVDDDGIFATVLAQAFERRGYHVRVVHDADSGIALARAEPPEYAVVDLRMPGASGLELVRVLKELDENTRIVMLTGYASIATAVEAIKLGAVHYLAKPADADEIQAAFHRDAGDTGVDVPDRPLSVNRLEWEHIQKVLQECDGNVSQTARRLNMHRRTLQRKLQKRPVRS